MPLAITNIAHGSITLGFQASSAFTSVQSVKFYVWVSDFWGSTGAFFQNPVGFDTESYTIITSSTTNPILGGSELGSIYEITGMSIVGESTLSVNLMAFGPFPGSVTRGVPVDSKITVYGLTVNNSSPNFTNSDSTVTTIACTNPVTAPPVLA